MTRRLARALTAALLALGLAPAAAPAQVFIASKPHPEFWIAPVFITANIARKDLGDNPGPLMLTVSFSVAPPPARDPSEFAQDIYLLWPGQLVGTDGADGADPMLVRQVESAGFKVLEMRERRVLLSQAAVRAISSYKEFAKGALHARDEDAEEAARALRVTVQQTFRDLQMKYLPRNWVEFIAVKA